MIDHDKAALRQHMSDLRRQVHLAGGADAAAALAACALPLTVAGRVVGGYWPMGSELDPRPLMARLAASGAVLALPVVVGRAQPLIFRRHDPSCELEIGPHGTHHPPPGAEQVSPDVILVPLLAFDRWGYRLGYGGGYYDRTLDLLHRGREITTIGIGFAAQQVDRIPHDALDQRLDAVLTEHGFIALESP